MSWHPSKFKILVLAILLAFAFRLINLEGRAIWYDEAFAILFSEKSLSAMLYGTVTSVQGGAADVHPILYYSLLHAWMNWVGETAFAARFLSVGLGVATVAVVYRVATSLFGEKEGSASAFILAIAPFHIAYSQEARMYALLGLTSALALLTFALYERTRRLKWWLLFVAAGVGVVYSHNLGCLILLAVGLWVLLKRDLMLLRGTVLAGIAIVLLWLPWLLLLPAELGKVSQSYWVPRPDLVTLIQTIVTFFVDFDNARLPPLLLPFGLFVALSLFAITAIQIARNLPNKNALFLLTLVLLPPMLLFLVSQWRPVYITRGLMASFLALAVLAAWGIVRMPNSARRVALLAMGLLTVTSLGFYYQYAEFPRPPFRQALAYLNAHVAGSDVVVHDNKLSYFPMHYYDLNRVQSFVADPSGAGSDTLALPTQEALGLFASSLDQVVQGHHRVWFVIFEEALTEGGGNLAWLNQNYRWIQTERFNDLDVYLYEK